MPDDHYPADAPPYAGSTESPLDGLVVATPAVRGTDRRRESQHADPESLAPQHEHLIRRQFQLLQQYREVPTLNPGHARLKRIVDFAVAIPALLLLSPILLLIAIAVRLDSPGPALFCQRRVGQHGHVFRMLKFRTMVNGAGVIQGSVHKQPGDKRVTRVGRFLRKTSLDELPQLINVLRGQMTLVGPRPEIPVVMIEHYQLWQYQRLSVPQGITGWWQVNGRGSKLMWQHTQDDLAYIEHASVWLDIRILVRTVRAVFRSDGAF